MTKRKTVEQLESELNLLKLRAKGLIARDEYKKARDAHKNRRW